MTESQFRALVEDAQALSCGKVTVDQLDPTWFSVVSSTTPLGRTFFATHTAALVRLLNGVPGLVTLVEGDRLRMRQKALWDCLRSMETRGVLPQAEVTRMSEALRQVEREVKDVPSFLLMKDCEIHRLREEVTKLREALATRAPEVESRA